MWMSRVELREGQSRGLVVNKQQLSQIRLQLNVAMVQENYYVL